MITEAKFLLRSAKGDGLACGFAGGHLDVNAGLGEDLVDAVALRSDDVTMLRLLHLDRNRGHLFLLRRKKVLQHYRPVSEIETHYC